VVVYLGRVVVCGWVFFVCLFCLCFLGGGCCILCPRSSVLASGMGAEGFALALDVDSNWVPWCACFVFHDRLTHVHCVVVVPYCVFFWRLWSWTLLLFLVLFVVARRCTRR